jgi:hypothetical protein
MIKIDVWLDSAITGKKTRIGQAEIWNTMDNHAHPYRGNYAARIHGKRNSKSKRLKNFPRKSRDVWELIRRILNEKPI